MGRGVLTVVHRGRKGGDTNSGYCYSFLNLFRCISQPTPNPNNYSEFLWVKHGPDFCGVRGSGLVKTEVSDKASELGWEFGRQKGSGGAQVQFMNSGLSRWYRGSRALDLCGRGRGLRGGPS